MYLVSEVVVQGRWHMYGYSIPLFQECYMRNVRCLTGEKHPTGHSMTMTSNYTTYMVSGFLCSQSQGSEQWTSVVELWSKDDDACMDLLSHGFVSVIWGMDHVWQRRITPQTTSLPPTTPRTCSAVTLFFWGGKSLYNVPHQWCSGPMKMTQVWICYPTVIWVLYKAWTTYGRGESPHRP